jgi:hypothetical protein
MQRFAPHTPPETRRTADTLLDAQPSAPETRRQPQSFDAHRSPAHGRARDHRTAERNHVSYLETQSPRCPPRFPAQHDIQADRDKHLLIRITARTLRQPQGHFPETTRQRGRQRLSAISESPARYVHVDRRTTRLRSPVGNAISRSFEQPLNLAQTDHRVNARQNGRTST